MPNQKNPFPGRQVALALGLIIVSVAYAVWQHLSGQPAATTPPPQPTPNTPTEQPITVTPVPQQTTPTPAQTPAPQKPAGQYVDGTYTGNPADAYYGTVQVKAVIKGGVLADVQWLQYPNRQANSRNISSQAMPLLTQEAITAQSANVDGVSGATETSGAFIQSLASALAKAK